MSYLPRLPLTNLALVPPPPTSHATAASLDHDTLEALRKAVRGHFRRRGVLAAELDDLVQTAMLRMWRSRHRLDPAREPLQYALRIAENLVRDRRVRRPIPISLEAPLGGEGSELTLADRLADPSDPFETVWQERATRPDSNGLAYSRGFRALLDALSELDRATLLLYAEGLPRKEAARRAGVSLATYGARLYRAQRRARELFPKYADGI